MNQERQKKEAAEAALEFISSGDVIGVGTGSTTNFFVDALVGIKRKRKDFLESIRKEKPMENGPDIIKMEKRNMMVPMSKVFRLASGTIIMNKVKRPWRKFILTAMKNVKKSTLQIVVVYPIFVKNWGK